MTDTIERFDQLALSAPLLTALAEVGYETPSPIQAACIPVLLEGRDLLGEAQTGTGKTAAFALPVLERLDLARKEPQALILTPTRELAIQVAEAFQKYAHHLPGFHVLPVYGGQAMSVQLRALKRGAHVIVGTPGRVMDHLERESLTLDGLRTLVLDEADEMLRMGFIEDVEWILEHTPRERQTALFSATMPEPIRRVARAQMREPQEVKIRAATATVAAIRQRFWVVPRGLEKIDALTRILEVEEDFEAAIVFVRTKTATVEVAEKLEARGYEAAALNGDMNQAMREQVIDRLKAGTLDIVVATDVAARGIDVPRVSHVINYDIPYDTEAYVHRIGRTGRAGRAGTAILFVAPRELRMLHFIERATRQPIERIALPTRQAVADRRIAQFKQQVLETLEAMEQDELDFFEDVVGQIEADSGQDAERLAAALAFMAQRERPLQLSPQEWPDEPTESRRPPREREVWSAREGYDERPRRPRGDDRGERPAWRESRTEGRRDAPEAGGAPRPPRERFGGDDRYAGPAPERHAPRPAERVPFGGEREQRQPRERERGEEAPRPGTHGLMRYRIDVGRAHGVLPKEIVGAIANEAGIEGRLIGRIDLFDDYSTVELPAGLPGELLGLLKRARVRQRPLNLRPATAAETGGGQFERGARGGPTFDKRTKRFGEGRPGGDDRAPRGEPAWRGPRRDGGHQPPRRSFPDKPGKRRG